MSREGAPKVFRYEDPNGFIFEPETGEEEVFVDQNGMEYIWLSGIDHQGKQIRMKKYFPRVAAPMPSNYSPIDGLHPGNSADGHVSWRGRGIPAKRLS